jgi:hypothetical protein
MKSGNADSIATLATERASPLEVPSFGTCEDMSCLEKLVAELLLKNQQLRFKLFAAQDQIERHDQKQQRKGTL